MATSPDVFFLTCGHLDVPSFVVSRTPIADLFGRARITNTIAVIVRGNGDIALVDAGFSTAVCEDPNRALGRLGALSYSIYPGNCTSMATQLTALGLDVSRVKHVIATHLHRDHINGVIDFPNAELVVSTPELQHFKTSYTGGYDESDIAAHRKSGRLHTIDYKREIFWGFDGAYDLFGDDAVRLLNATGHTNGSMAVAMRRHDKWYLHIGDAAYSEWEYRDRDRTVLSRFAAKNSKDLLATYTRICASAESKDKPVVVPSHDAKAFRDLPQRPIAAF
jgi:glyoxylase-like metal-dependent hydrolase (beta-lactamase superfamily II)